MPVEEIILTTDESPDYENAYRLNHSLWSDFDEMEKAIDGFYEELKPLNETISRAQTNRIRQALRILLSNLYHATKAGKYLRYSRDNNAYSGAGHCAYLGLNYHHVVAIMDTLDQLGYIADSRGGIFYPIISMVTRIKANDTFIHKMEEAFGVNAHTIILDEDAIKPFSLDTAIKMKDENDHIIPNFPDNEASTQLREEITRYNELLSRTYIDVNDAHLPDGEPHSYDLSCKHVYASFKYRSYELGGRLYGAWWMYCKKRVRQCITINGQRTRELDYKALHPTLLYALAGETMAADPYDTSILPSGFADHEKARNLMKMFFMMLINCKDKASAAKALQTEIRFNPERYPPIENIHPYFSDILYRYRALHAPIQDSFFSEQALRLQNIDGKITMHLIKSLMNREEPIPILTIHDSYVYDFNHYEIVHENMRESLRTILSEYQLDSHTRDIISDIKKEQNVVRNNLDRPPPDDSPYAKRLALWRETHNPNLFY